MDRILVNFSSFYLAPYRANGMTFLTETLTGLATIRAFKDQVSAPI
jgi:hypothetical protein